MKKLLVLVILAGGAAILYSIFSDPVRREDFLRTIEGSTGVDLESDPAGITGQAGRAMGDAAGKLMNSLGDYLSDPRLRRSLERWGRDALETLDDSRLKDFSRDLERELRREGGDVDEVFRKYLGEAGDS